MSRGRPGLISQISRQGWEWNKRKTAVLEPCLLLMRVLACRRVRPAQDGRPFFCLFKALRPCAQQMNEPRGGVARDGRSTNGVKELCPSGALARAQHQTLPEGSNMTTSVRSSPTTSETASRTLPSVANLAHQSIPHPPLRRGGGDAGTGGEVMFLDGPARHRPCPRSSLTVPLPRGRVVFYSRNNLTSDHVFQLSPMFSLSRASVCLMIFIAVTTGSGRLAGEFPVSVSRTTRTGESRTASHAGKRKKDHGMELVSRLQGARVALCPRKQPFVEAILAPAGAQSINAQQTSRSKSRLETRTASGPNARLHAAQWAGEANDFSPNSPPLGYIT